MKRRRFIRTASAVLAAAALPPALSRGGEFTGTIKKAIKFPNIDEPTLSIVDKFKLLKDLGFDGVELRGTHADQKSEFIAARDRTGLPIHGLVHGSDPDIAPAIEFCAAVGGNGILVTAPYDKKRPLMESWNERQDIIRAALPAAEKHQVKILVENVWAGFLISALDTERFIDEVGNPWFGSYFDVGNNVRWGVPEHWIQVLGPRIGKLDIKEWDETLHKSEGLRKGFTRELGNGTIDWAEVRAALKQINYSGWATAEVGNADRTRLADIARGMDTVLGLGQGLDGASMVPLGQGQS
ncbi:MAG: sugar phosphate isomerase/epimerase family protein [Verrucomicrobiales bacterium]